jgi:uncharacterized protein YceH (UPF0502 family)
MDCRVIVEVPYSEWRAAMSDIAPRPAEAQKPRWRPLSAIDRRVAGVLVEKAKTTPDAYPMSANALKSGANQKNNRYPLMELELEDIEESLARLRAAGAVAEVQGGGRVPRFRHYLYEWLGVDKVDLAVMAELLLRGAQTEGELRGRAARMEPIADLAALRPVLASLKQKNLIISLTPEGRGHMLTHALYEPQELEKVRREIRAAAPALETGAGGDAQGASPRPSTRPADGQVSAVERFPQASAADSGQQAIAALRRELDDVRADLASLRKDLDALRSSLS